MGGCTAISCIGATVSIKGAFTVRMFNRKKGGWLELPVKDNTVSFKLGAGSGELLKIEK